MLTFYLSMIQTEKERDLFIDLYNKYRFSLYGYACKYLNNSSYAEDIVHDVFCMIADECIGDLLERSAEHRRRFLFLCTRNRAINWIKHNSKTISIEALVENGQDISDNFSFDSFVESLAEKDLLESAKSAINNLDPIYGDGLWMHIRGYASSSIAKFFNEKPETVRKRLYRGKQLLRSAVGMEGGEGE